MLHLLLTATLVLEACTAQAIKHTSGTIEPVPLQDVTLKYDSRYDKAVSLNREYILGLDTDRLLKNFRCGSC